jgi:hypothetical protein
MTIWELGLILSFIVVGGIAFLAIMLRLGPSRKKPVTIGSIQEKAEEDVEHIFNQDFREELRNRGRLHFEKILGENAMFLQQDLRLTTAQLNDYMKNEISKDLKKAFDNYQEAIESAKQLATESIQKTKEAVDEQRKSLGAQMEKEISEERERRIKHFEENMTDIINHYLEEAIGDQIDLQDQLEYILGELDSNKQAILEDVRSGA